MIHFIVIFGFLIISGIVCLSVFIGTQSSKGYVKNTTKEFENIKHIIESYLENSKLCKLCENYAAKSEDLYLEDLESEILDFISAKNINSLLDYKQNIDNDVTAKKQIKSIAINSLISCYTYSFNHRTIFYNHKLLTDSEGIEKLDNLYKYAIRKGLIFDSENNESYNAFLYLIYIYKKIQFVDEYFKKLDIYSVDEGQSDDVIIEQLWEEIYSVDEIIDILVAKELKINNYENMYIDLIDKFGFVEDKVEEIENDEDFDDLLDD